MEPEIIAAMIAGVVSVVSIAFTVWWQGREKRRDDKLRYALSKIDLQLSELYGPLVGLSIAGRSAMEAFFATSIREGLMQVDQTSVFPTSNPKLAHKWRMYIKDVMMPINIQTEALLRSKAGLVLELETGLANLQQANMFEGEFPSTYPHCFVKVLEHIAAYKGLVASWAILPDDDDSFTDSKFNVCHINFPADYSSYVSHCFDELKREQRRLLHLTRPGKGFYGAIPGSSSTRAGIRASRLRALDRARSPPGGPSGRPYGRSRTGAAL